jgi:hypothetical protein
VSSASTRAKVAGSTEEAKVSDTDWQTGGESSDEEEAEDELGTIEPEEQEDEPWAT